MFYDWTRIKFRAGNGGNGRVAFGFNSVALGGTGGDGGNVYLEGSNSMYDFTGIKPDYVYAAEHGQMGGEKNLTGRTGNHLIFKVPLMTKVYNEDGKLLQTVSEHGQRVLLLEGGQGGLGNWYYRKGGIKNADRHTEGKPGQQLNARLELELQGDIIFIGLPNAGKSSILNEFTNADGKVAAYPFTTLIPQLGRMGNDIRLMDLPGLIENTSEGKGLGTKFEKHTCAAKLIAHFVSLESADPVADYELIRKELTAINPKLAAKPEIIVITKTDLIPAADIAEKIKLFKKFKKPVIAISIHDLDALNKLKQMFVDEMEKLALVKEISEKTENQLNL